MIEIHCYDCGGFIGDPTQIAHRLPPNATHKSFAATPTSALCACRPPVVYGPPAGRASSPSLN